MAHDQTLTAQAVEWCEEAADILSDAVDAGAIGDIRRQVENGATLFRLSHGSALVGYYVLRVDHMMNHSEGVVVAGSGRHPDIDLTLVALPMVERQFTGCKYIRIHTSRAGLIKKIRSLGYEPQEFVMRKATNVEL